MADYVGYLIDVRDGLIFCGLDSPAPVITDYSGYPLEIEELVYAATGVAEGSIPLSYGYLLPRPELFYAGHDLPGASGKIGSDSRGYLIALDIFPGDEADDSFLIGFDDDTIPSFPVDSSMVEIIYPVKPITDLNRVLFQVGTEEWRRTIKSNAPVPKETDTIRFRVDTSYMPTFLGELESNKLNQFRLTTPGYTPFGSESMDNFVRVFAHSRPRRESDGFTQLVDVTFLFVAAI